jgi:hypothetical protein
VSDARALRLIPSKDGTSPPRTLLFFIIERWP